MTIINNFSSSSTGLFAGILFLIVTFVSMGVYSVFTQLHNNKSAQLVFGLADLALFAVSLAASIIGIYRYVGHIFSTCLLTIDWSNLGFFVLITGKIEGQ